MLFTQQNNSCYVIIFFCYLLYRCYAVVHSNDEDRMLAVDLTNERRRRRKKKRISQSWNTLTHYIKLLWVRWAPDLKILKRPTIRTENLQNPRWCHDGSHLFPSIFKDHAVLVEVPERTVNHWASANFLSLSLYENQCSWTLLHCNQGNSAQSQHITDRRALPANASNNSRRARRRTEATRPNHFYTVNQEDVLLVLLKYQIGAPVSVMT